MELAEGLRMRLLGLLVAWLFGFTVVLLLCAIFAPSALDIFLETLGELL